MTLLAEESAIMTTTIFNKMADSIILISEKEHNDNSVDQTMRQLDMAVNLDAGVRIGNVGAKNY